MNSKAVAGLVAGALVVGLFVGVAVASGDDGTSKVSGPGPTKVVDGVPVGYERSKNGAVAAAASYAGSVGSIALATADGRAAALRTMTAPDVLEEVRGGMEPGLEALAKGLGPDAEKNALVRAAPVAYRVAAYTGESARVELWGVGVVGNAGALPPSASWGITSVDLRWVDGDWKLAGLLKQSEGPTPQQSGQPTAAQDLVVSIRDFRSFHHVPAR